MIALGIDGCVGGWIAVMTTKYEYQIKFSDHIDGFTEWIHEADSVLIDMPIGLPEREAEALLRPENEVRRILGKKASSVFNTPCRQALQTEDYTTANKVNREILGKGLSKQSFYIGNKIKELDNFFAENDFYRNKVKESHPELLFLKLSADGLPIMEKKKTIEGMDKRLQVLGNHSHYIEHFKKRLTGDVSLSKVKDDAIDAYCLAVAGQVGLANQFQTIPETPSVDGRGLLMRMTYPSID